MLFSWARRNMIHEKNLKQVISWHCPIERFFAQVLLVDKGLGTFCGATVLSRYKNMFHIMQYTVLDTVYGTVFDIVCGHIRATILYSLWRSLAGNTRPMSLTNIVQSIRLTNIHRRPMAYTIIHRPMGLTLIHRSEVLTSFLSPATLTNIHQPLAPTGILRRSDLRRSYTYYIVACSLLAY